MVAPITGPYSTQLVLLGPPTSFGFRPRWFFLRRTWYRQRRPHNLPLNLSLDKRFIESYRGTGGPDYVEYSSLPSAMDMPQMDYAYAQAYGKFREAVRGDTPEMAVNLAERKQSLDMIARRSIQLWKFTRAVRQFRWGDAAKHLGLRSSATPPKSRLKENAKAFGNNWLEFHFGWSPLIGDIGNAVELLQGDLRPFRVQKRFSYYSTSKAVVGSSPTYDQVFLDQSRVVIQADLVVTNPNLLLANQLGFVNPATVAWELVPFSFVVDWFANVGDFLGSFSDFWGVSLHQPFVTRFQKRQMSSSARKDPRQWKGTSIFETRTVGSPPGPKLLIRPPWRLSPTRALTSVGLLLQRLR